MEINRFDCNPKILNVHINTDGEIYCSSFALILTRYPNFYLYHDIVLFNESYFLNDLWTPRKIFILVVLQFSDICKNEKIITFYKKYANKIKYKCINYAQTDKFCYMLAVKYYNENLDDKYNETDVQWYLKSRTDLITNVIEYYESITSYVHNIIIYILKYEQKCAKIINNSLNMINDLTELTIEDSDGFSKSREKEINAGSDGFFPNTKSYDAISDIKYVVDKIESNTLVGYICNTNLLLIKSVLYFLLCDFYEMDPDATFYQRLLDIIPFRINNYLILLHQCTRNSLVFNNLALSFSICNSPDFWFYCYEIMIKLNVTISDQQLFYTIPNSYSYLLIRGFEYFRDEIHATILSWISFNTLDYRNFRHYVKYTKNLTQTECFRLLTYNSKKRLYNWLV